jgi:ribose 5-phosphate isomerase B
MKIIIGSDHRGFAYKQLIIEQMRDIDLIPIEWIDVGAFDKERSDYPQFAIDLAQRIVQKQAQFGVLLCGSGIGMAIAANRFPGIYAAVAWSEEAAIMGREDDNANVLVIPSDFLSGDDQAILIIRAWLRAQFKGGRYQERLNMIDKIRV